MCCLPDRDSSLLFVREPPDGCDKVIVEEPRSVSVLHRYKNQNTFICPPWGCSLVMDGR